MKCPACNGKGYTDQHSMDDNAHDEAGNCNPGFCPVQEQCPHCQGTGDMPTVSEVKALRDEVIALRKQVEKQRWISVKERLPEGDKLVIVKLENLKIPIRAFHAEPKGSEGSCEDEISIYDEEADCYWLPEGWYECNQYEEVNWLVHDNVTHWQPLPAPPAIEGETGA